MEVNMCQGEGCGQPSTLKCPTCQKKGLPDAFFCSQECFRKNWNAHKLVHRLAAAVGSAPKSKHLAKFQGFVFSGALRPAELSPKRHVPEHIPRPDYADHPEGRSKREDDVTRGQAIPVYTKKQIKGIRKACIIGREILDLAGSVIKPGLTTDELDRICHEAIVERGAYPSPLNYYGFPKSICTSINETICHGIPDARELQEGDICNVDISVYWHDGQEGYHGDLNETFFVGKVSEEARRLVQTTYECLEKAIEMVKPRTLYRQVGHAIQKHASAAGFSVVKAYCGHGVGMLFHTDPNVPHYARNKAVGRMQPGHIFTIEPMINVGSHKAMTWPDDWTATTRDGKLSAQFEHTLLVTETGVEILTKRRWGSYLEPIPPPGTSLRSIVHGGPESSNGPKRKRNRKKKKKRGAGGDGGADGDNDTTGDQGKVDPSKDSTA